MITRPLGRRFKGEPVHDVAHAPQISILISRAGIDINANARKMSRQGLGGNAHTIRECRDLIELCGILGRVSFLDLCFMDEAIPSGGDQPRLPDSASAGPTRRLPGPSASKPLERRLLKRNIST